MREIVADPTPRPSAGEPPPVLAVALLGAVIASRFLAIAAAPGEIDEAVFAGAVHRFDIADLSPQAPGFPVWILLGRALLPLAPGAFHALAVAATLLSCLGLPALYLWGRRLVGGWAALGAAVFAAFLPVVWVNGGRAFSDTPSTALFLASLAALGAASARAVSGRPGAVSLAVLAGLAAAAGAGVRPHLVLAFGPLLLVEALLLVRSRSGRPVAAALVASGLAGTAAWLAWLLKQTGGVRGFLAGIDERASFRSGAFETGRFGSILDSFLVRDFLSWPLALVIALLALLGLGATFRRLPRGAAALLLVLAPAFYSLWFLHSREMSRYSVPFVLVLALPVAAGVEVLVRRPPLGLAAMVAGAALAGRASWGEVRYGATNPTPPSAAIDALSLYGHPGRETIVSDGIFNAFLRLERWEKRLRVWPLSDDILLREGVRRNRRLVRLADFTSEGDSPDRTDPAWRVFRHEGRVARALGNGRLFVVAVRDPAPPLFGPGFGPRESVPGRPSTRWAGPEARLIVPGLQGPPVALVRGVRYAHEGATTLRARDAETGQIVLERRIDPGEFEVAFLPQPIYGPLPKPRELVLSCDRPEAVPEAPGLVRPSRGCFLFREATFSLPPEEIWERLGEERLLDFGRPRDAWANLEGFHDREVHEKSGASWRWTSGRASFTWFPVPDLEPGEIVLRARTPSGAGVRVDVAFDGRAAGNVEIPPGDFAEVRIPLDPPARERLRAGDPVRITLATPVLVPRDAGLGGDPRRLGIALDRVLLR